MWEDLVDAMAQTRLQDEYNKAIRDCDIFVMLFSTKVGKYTEEEFETAFGQIKSTQKPLIYTYFKDMAIPTSSLRREHLDSLLNFQDKLQRLGHFYTVYKNIEDLKYQFDQQLDKLLERVAFTQQTNHGSAKPGGSLSKKRDKVDIGQVTAMLSKRYRYLPLGSGILFLLVVGAGLWYTLAWKPIAEYFFSRVALVIDTISKSQRNTDSTQPSDAAKPPAANRRPLPNLLVSLCGEYEYYDEDQTKSCTEVGSFTGIADGPFRIHGGNVGRTSTKWSALLLRVPNCELCREPLRLRLFTATYSATPCSLEVEIDPNNIKKFNKRIHHVDLDTRQSVELPIEDQVKNGYRTFLLVSNPSGCDLVLTSVTLE